MNLYQPYYSPWLDDTGDFRRFYDAGNSRSLVSMDRCWSVYCFLQQALHIEGEVWELGVYRGGLSAMMGWLLDKHRSNKTLRLFDTFAGMPATLPIDEHQEGQFADVVMEEIYELIRYRGMRLHKGMIQDTVPRNLEPIAFAHIDMDIYTSTKFALEAIWDRVSIGGILVFDDYGFPQCVGCRTAVDEFFAGKPSVPLVLGNGQAIVFKGSA